MENIQVKELDNVVVLFAGDSGDGMQLTGTLFSNISAVIGNEISTFPDYPSEIRAPQGTLGGVSGFQVHIGSSKVYTPGDEVDIFVAMNPAALKVNIKKVKKGGAIIFDVDSFQKTDLTKANFITDDPFTELAVSDTITLIPAQLTTLTQQSLDGFGLDGKDVLRSKNMFALGLVCWLFNRPMDKAEHFIENKFKKKPTVQQANIKVMNDGFNYGNNLHLTIPTYTIERSGDTKPGRYTSISGNKATSYGLIAAAEKAGLPLFLGSYPITPASDIMEDLALRRDLGVKVMQCEDEIAGIATAIGASFAGNLAATNTSGPGLALKSEAIGLAVMAELPLVIIDVMRGGPSTGMPTKTEQTDLLQALHGRNGESPVVVIAPSTPDDCFHYTYMASKIALEYMTPVIVLSDAFIGNGTSLWRLPKLADLPEIKPNYVPADFENYNATSRNEETKVRYWSFPGTEGFEYRNGGLEKDYYKGSISTDPKNHQKMVDTRAAKVQNVQRDIPDLEIFGDENADLLVVGWGSTKGHLMGTVSNMLKKGKKVAMTHFNYINPLPKNTAEVLGKFKNIVVCELNSGQFASHLRAQIPGVNILQYNKVQGQPFTVTELEEQLNKFES
ncbi:MAG: 2-oxoacid:acceptor oxidoreductase subunit alpha [Porphyromonadaceae bacterium]|nr:2-oxoacid:acceptor oxidoreductase subunit alpha [Porphyromonadaceae bacterium]